MIMKFHNIITNENELKEYVLKILVIFNLFVLFLFSTNKYNVVIIYISNTIFFVLIIKRI
jgi:hypothetical protein